MKSFIFSFLLLSLVIGLTNAQNVEIPDANFLITLMDEGVDTSENSIVDFNTEHTDLNVFSFFDIKETLMDQRPQSGDFISRQIAIMNIDTLIRGTYPPLHPETSGFLVTMIRKAILEIKNEIVTEGATVWQIYNHGFVVKTPTVCFGFDLRDYFEFEEFLELADLLDVLFVSHEHKDHYSKKLVNKINSMDQPVVGPSEMSPTLINLPMHAGDCTMVSGLNVIAHYGAHKVPVRQFEVITPEGIKLLHTGDNHSISTIPTIEEVDILMLNSWIEWGGGGHINPDRVKAAIDKVNPKVTFPAHISELGHLRNGNPPHWSDVFLLDDSDVDGKFVALTWGERYHFDNNSNDTLRPNAIENPEYQIKEDSILITWDPPLPSDDGDTGFFYRICINNDIDRLQTDQEFSVAWDSIGNYPFKVFSYDDCGNQSDNSPVINAIVPDINHPPRIISCYPFNTDTFQWYSGVIRTFRIEVYDPNDDELKYTWTLDNDPILDATTSEMVYNFADIEPGIYSLGAMVSDLQYSKNNFWILKISDPTGVRQLLDHWISINPNPTNELLNVETNQYGLHIIEIHSQNGHLLYRTKREGPTFQIDLSSFQKGLYFITVRSRDYVRTEKIIKL